MQNEDQLQPMNEEEARALILGVENPEVIDLIRLDPKSGEVELVITEKRAWDGGRRQLEQFDEKLNRYMTYILNGFVGRHYPEYEGRPVRIVIDAEEPPTGDDLLRFFGGVSSVCEANDIGFSIRAGGGGE